MQRQESTLPSLSPDQPDSGKEYIWYGMIDDRNTHTLLYVRNYRTLGDIAAKTVKELVDEGFETHEIASMGRLLASRELAFTPVTADTPPNEPVEVATAALAIATEATTAPSMPQHLQTAA